MIDTEADNTNFRSSQDVVPTATLGKLGSLPRTYTRCRKALSRIVNISVVPYYTERTMRVNNLLLKFKLSGTSGSALQGRVVQPFSQR